VIISSVLDVKTVMNYFMIFY